MATASFVIICRAYLYYKTTEVLWSPGSTLSIIFFFFEYIFLAWYQRARTLTSPTSIASSANFFCIDYNLNFENLWNRVIFIKHAFILIWILQTCTLIIVYPINQNFLISDTADNTTQSTFADSIVNKAPTSHVTSVALIGALSFGIIFFLAIVGLVIKRGFDSWQRRHYSRIDYLVNGMYN